MGCGMSGNANSDKESGGRESAPQVLPALAQASTAPLSEEGSVVHNGAAADADDGRASGGGSGSGVGSSSHIGKKRLGFADRLGAAFRFGSGSGQDGKRQRVLGGSGGVDAEDRRAGEALGARGHAESGHSVSCGSGEHDTSVGGGRLRRQPSTYNSVHNLVLTHKLSALGTSGGRVGLRNLGNTCFMNSALQCLSNCMALTDYFLGFDWKKELNRSNPLGHGGSIAEAYGDLINNLWTTNAKDLAPATFKAKVGRVMPQFSGYDQHDVQEFIALLLDAVHEDLNRCTTKPYVEDVYADGTRPEEAVAMEAWKGYLLRNKSIIVDTFQGQLRSRLRCKKCGHTSVKFDPFMYLSLPMGRVHDGETVTLERCLSLFCEQENLEGENHWFCPKCKRARAATKQLSLWKLPPVLIIHLKRFECSGRGGRSKLNANVSYPLQYLDLSRFVESPQREAPDYDLFGVACHHGSLWGGHYTAFCRNRVDDKWYQLNDANVHAVEPAEVQSSAAYVLFYCKMAEMEVKGEPPVLAGPAFAPEGTAQLAAAEPAAAGNGRISSGGSGGGRVAIDRAPQLIRRQSLTKPHLWPHVVLGSPSPGSAAVAKQGGVAAKAAAGGVGASMLSPAPAPAAAASAAMETQRDSMALEEAEDEPPNE